MATVGQVYYRVVDNNSGSYISSGQDIYSDIVSQYGASTLTDLGVEAPPGTQMVLNTSKSIMVGRTGHYEIHDDIEITNLYFVQPKNYVKDDDATDAALKEGAEAMEAAETERASSLATLDASYEGKDKDTSYWDSYNTIQETYSEAYEAALATYTTGVNGVYKLGTPAYKELDNVIVNFLYT